MTANPRIPDPARMQAHVDGLAAAIADVATAADSLRRFGRDTEAESSMSFMANGLDAIHSRLACRLEGLAAELGNTLDKS